MANHRSIQDIIPPARSHPIRPNLQSDVGMVPPPPTPPQPMRLTPEKGGLAKFIFIGAGILIVLGIGIAILSTVFHRAYVTLTPYSYTANVQETIQTTPNNTAVPYQKVEVTDTATKSVPATGSQHVENHSSGTITVYNAYATTQQRLITNTRFQTKDGLVYRIHTPIVIPGYTMKAGLKVPGSVEAVVYADEAGPKYNIDLTEFTIPGLKGTKQYDLISARSRTPMSGGFIGEQAVVDPAVRTQTVDALKADLDRSLRAKVSAAKVAGTIIFNDTIVITYMENGDTVDGKNAAISVSGRATTHAFSENALAKNFAASTGVTYDGPLSIQNPADLGAHIDLPSAIGTDTPISIAVSGTARLVATFDQGALAKDLAGRNKKDIQTVFAKYPAISTIDVKVFPFWVSTLPTDPAKISIKVVDTLPAGNP
ncbi:hypothetical protein HY090_02655 [Candidatus Kaiserbacteria bacterium]|nr:hypothetical protein [Candidatus Kaiserbacteria bacterium]